MHGVGEVLGFVFSFIVILSLAYVIIYLISNHYSKLMKSKNMQVTESLSLGIDKALHLIKVGEKFYLISSTKQSVSMLCEVDPKEIAPQKQIIIEPHSAFKDLLDKIIKQRRGKQDE